MCDLSSCRCQFNMGADRDGRDVSNAMGISSQVGNVLTSRLCDSVCVKVLGLVLGLGDVCVCRCEHLDVFLKYPGG